jgi:uncharacterized protein
MVPLDMHDVPIIGGPAPLPSGIDESFWAGLQGGELRVQRCAGCQKWTWPPQWRCGTCGSWEFGWEGVEPAGLIFSWTRVHRAWAPEMGPFLPYVSLLVELPHAGDVRLMGMLVGSEEGLRIGARVTGVIQSPKATGEYPIMRWMLDREGGAPS